MHPIPEEIARHIESTLWSTWSNPHAGATQVKAALCLSLGFYGLRQCEARALKRRDLDASGRCLWVKSAKHGTPRRITLHADYADRLAGTWHTIKHPQHKGRWTPHLFTTQWGNPVRNETIHRWTFRFIKWWGDYSWHSMRHTAAIRCWNETQDELAIMRLLGHATLRQTHHYLQTLIHVPITSGPRWPEPTSDALHAPTILKLYA